MGYRARTIEGVRIRNERGEVTSSLLGLARMQVEIDYAVDDPAADEPDFAVKVTQLDGDLLFAAHSGTHEVGLDAPRPRGSVVLVIPELPLLQGRFVLTVGVTAKHGTEVYHELDRWLEFSVFAPTRGNGPVAVRHHWEALPEARSAAFTYSARD